MQAEFSFFDIIFLIAMAFFIVSRFMGSNLPKEDKNKKTKNIVNFPELKVKTEVKKIVKKNKNKPNLEGLSGLEQIKTIDKNFNEKEFLAGAEIAYSMYYEALNNLDEETLEDILSPRKFDEIIESIETLEEENKKRLVTLEKMENIEILDSRLHGRTAIIDVKYTVKQKDSIENIDAKENSKEAKVKEVSTVWTWARNLDSDDLNWELESISLLS